MSENVCYKGRIRLVATGEVNSEAYSRNYLKEIGVTDLPNGYSSFTEIIHEYNHELIDNSLYLIVTKETLGEGDVFHLSVTEDPLELDYVVQYYNGGTCFSEAIEQAFKNLKKR